VDIVVLGGGGSGLAAAVAAGQRGVDVLLLESQPHLGGTTALSVGSITAAGTRLQRRAGVMDSAEALAEDMWKFDLNLLAGDSPELRTLLATEAASTVAWLEDLGVAFSGPYPEPPHRVPRMHNVIPNSKTYIVRLTEAAERLGVAIACGVDVSELVQEREKVVGVRVRWADGTHCVRARKGVVLATGDFSGNAEMRHTYLSPAAAAARPINETANGDGHRLGESVGAQTRAMEVTFGPQLRFSPPASTGLIDRLPTWRWLCKLEAAVVRALPPSALRPFVKSLLITHMSPSGALFAEGAVLVNRLGERFCEEKSSVAELSTQPEGEGWIIMDTRIATLFSRAPNAISTAPGIAFAYFDDYRRGRPDLVHEAATSEELARDCHLDAAALEESVRSAGLVAPLVAIGPCYSTLTVTEGALAVDASLRVLDTEGNPVEGLYAVGAVGQGGMMLLGHGHHIGWAMTSGRVAGETVARRFWAGSASAVNDQPARP